MPMLKDAMADFLEAASSVTLDFVTIDFVRTNDHREMEFKHRYKKSSIGSHVSGQLRRRTSTSSIIRIPAWGTELLERKVK